MTQPITRKRALELAQACIGIVMLETNAKMKSKYFSVRMREKDEAEYAELAAALAYIENLARQKELL